jgi:hypothetical protein
MPVGDSVVSWLAVDEYASTASGLEVSESLIFYLGLHFLWGPGQCSQYSDLLWAGQFGAGIPMEERDFLFSLLV